MLQVPCQRESLNLATVYTAIFVSPVRSDGNVSPISLPTRSEETLEMPQKNAFTTLACTLQI
jgi:hypothetical protein